MEILPEVKNLVKPQNQLLGSSNKLNLQQSGQNYQIAHFTSIDPPNPILPLDMHKQQQPIKLQLNGNIRFNQTYFSAQYKSKRALYTTIMPSNISQNSKQTAKSSSNITHQFEQLLSSRILVYQRINNDQLNEIGGNCKQKFYCSIFFNAKNITTNHIPIYEYLSHKNKTQVISISSEKIIFNSAFECGNLFTALRAPSNTLPTYQLYLQNDTNTKGCTQWFYFSAQSKIKGKVKFRIMNFYKSASLYSKGMKTLFSKDNIQWKRTGTAIQYGTLSVLEDKTTYCLDFIHDFDTIMEITYFAYGFPYSYSVNLNNLFDRISQKQSKKIFRKNILCQSNMGNNVYALSITEPSISIIRREQQKPIIYIIGRQHPGQTPSSFIIDGLIQFLVSDRVEAEELRANFIFRVVPMINVDGVINGNYRSNCSGNDLNRQWDFPSKKLHSEIFHLKQQIMSCKKNIIFFLDIHAHSRKMNSFFYGSQSSDNQNKLFPFVCSKLSRFISYQDCSFSDHPSKKTTARVILENQLQLKNSLTFEASFFGWEDDKKKIRHHFKIKDYNHIGQSLGLGIFYKQIGIKRVSMLREQINKELILVPISKQKTNLTSYRIQSVKKNQTLSVWKQIDKNSQKILIKWKKMIENQQKLMNIDQVSEGSSVQPEHFQLKAEQQAIINQQIPKQVIRNIQNQRFNNNWSNLTQYSKNGKKSQFRMKMINNPEQRRDQTSLLLQKKTKKEKMTVKGDKETLLIYPTERSGNDSLIVKHLQSQLQVPKRKNEKQSTNVNFSKQGSIFKKSIDDQKPNRYSILQVKKAINSVLDTKVFDEDKHFTNTRYNRSKQVSDSRNNYIKKK